MLTIRSLRIFNPVTFFCGGVSRLGVRVFRRTQKPPFFFTGPVDNRQSPPVPPVFKSPHHNSQRPQTAAGETVRNSRRLQVSRAVFVEIPPTQANQPAESVSSSHNTVGKSVSRTPTFNRDHRFFDTRETMSAYRARKSYGKERTSEPVTCAESSVADNFSSSPVSSTHHQGERVDMRNFRELLRARKLREEGSASKPVNCAGSSVPDNFSSSPISSTRHQGERVDMRNFRELLRAHKLREEGSASKPVNCAGSSVADNVSSSPVSSTRHQGERVDMRNFRELLRAHKLREEGSASKPVNCAGSSVADNVSSSPISSTRHQGERVDMRNFRELFRARKSREEGSASKPVNHASSSVPDNFFSSPVSSTHHQSEVFESLSQQAIDIIVKDLQTRGSWDNMAGEIAPKAVIDLPSWPKDKHLQVNGPTVNDFPSWSVEYGKQAATSPIILQLQSNHYEPVVEGRKVAVAGDGNCFYHSLLLALSTSEQQQLLGTAFIPYDRKSVADDSGNPNMMALRQLLANHVQQNPSLISAHLTEQGLREERIIQEDEKLPKEQQVAEDATLAQALQAEEAAALAKEQQVAGDLAWAQTLQADDFWVRF